MQGWGVRAENAAALQCALQLRDIDELQVPSDVKHEESTDDDA